MPKGIMRVIPTSPKAVRVSMKETKERGKKYTNLTPTKGKDKGKTTYGILTENHMKLNKKSPLQVKVIFSNQAE